MSKLQKKPSALKRGHPTLQNMNFYQFFSTFVGHFCLLDPDPDSESGSTGPIKSGSNPDPDPKHWVWVLKNVEIRNDLVLIFKSFQIRIQSRKVYSGLGIRPVQEVPDPPTGK
jgi:hypothetical protein